MYEHTNARMIFSFRYSYFVFSQVKGLYFVDTVLIHLFFVIS
uniref:Uncharacterized protein n=1 Tax=Setaria italica TaxID=4555 RepID=K4AP19_SETIT